MLNKLAIGISILALLSGGAPRAGAADEERQVTWDGLSAVVGQRVRVVMPDGARLEGKATALESDALSVEIQKTSNQTAYPKGKFLVPRATLGAVDVPQRSTKHWRIACVAAGALLGYVAARGAINAHKSGSTGAAVGFGAAAGGLPTLGYLLGNAADRRTITYVITQ